MKKFAVQFGFDILVEAEDKEKALELAKKELPTISGGVHIFCDGIKECDKNWDYFNQD